MSEIADTRNAAEIFRVCAIQRSHLQFEDGFLLQLTLQNRGLIAGQHLTGIDDGHPITEFVRFDHVVGRQHNGAIWVLLHPITYEMAYVACRTNVESDGRLIKKDHRWVGHEPAHHVDFLAHSG